jgi:hypothetical protein
VQMLSANSLNGTRSVNDFAKLKYVLNKVPFPRKTVQSELALSMAGDLGVLVATIGC